MKSKFELTHPPQLFAVIRHDGNIFCAPVIASGTEFVSFPVELDVDVLCFGHAKMLQKAFRIIEGSMGDFNTYRNEDLASQFYSLISDTFIAHHYLEMIGEDKPADWPVIEQTFVDFMVYICGELRDAGVKDINMAIELQRYLNAMLNLNSPEMQGLLYEIVPLIPRVLEKFSDDTEIARVQGSQILGYTEAPDEDVWGGLFTDDKEEE